MVENIVGKGENADYHTILSLDSLPNDRMLDKMSKLEAYEKKGDLKFEFCYVN